MPTQSLQGVVDIISAFEPLDSQAGIDSESVKVGGADSYTFALTFGAVTGDSVMKFYLGNTVGAKTTAIPFTYRLSSADYKAANADQFGAGVDVAATGLTLVAATFDHRTVLVEFKAADLAALVAVNGYYWLTCELDGTATVLLVSGVILCRGMRYLPPASQISSA
jgi:hypothetical protein